MKRFLVDMALPPRLAEFLTEIGHDAVHARDIGLSIALDEEIVDRARREDRVVVTADLDFPQLLALSGAGEPGVVLFRVGAYSHEDIRNLMARLLNSPYAMELETSMTVVERERIRVTRLPIQRNC